MRLTPDILRATYDFLRETPPFHRWRLPPGSEVAFSVRATRDAVDLGYHNAPVRGVTDRHVVGVVRRKVAHSSNLVLIMAHEMVHVAVSLHHPSERGGHGANFKRMAAQVCKHHGFDPLFF